MRFFEVIDCSFIVAASCLYSSCQIQTWFLCILDSLCLLSADESAPFKGKKSLLHAFRLRVLAMLDVCFGESEHEFCSILFVKFISHPSLQELNSLIIISELRKTFAASKYFYNSIIFVERFNQPVQDRDIFLRVSPWVVLYVAARRSAILVNKKLISPWNLSSPSFELMISTALS